MKKVLLFLLLIVLPLVVSAQCKDCFQKDDSWKFAAGVTLYSNMTYSPSLQIKQPLEFNFKYKLKDRHLLRASLPIAWKTKVYGSPVYPYSFTEISPEDYVKNMQTNLDYNIYSKVIEYYYNIYGISVGYEYNYPVWNQLSIFGGFDIAYYHQYVYSKYYDITYSQLNENYQSSLGIASLGELQLNKNNLLIKPLIGVRYQFQKILIEGNIGYYYSKYSNITDMKGTGWYDPGIIVGNSYHGSNQLDFNKFTYNISLYYTF